MLVNQVHNIAEHVNEQQLVAMYSFHCICFTIMLEIVYLLCLSHGGTTSQNTSMNIFFVVMYSFHLFLFCASPMSFVYCVLVQVHFLLCHLFDNNNGTQSC